MTSLRTCWIARPPAKVLAPAILLGGATLALALGGCSTGAEERAAGKRLVAGAAEPARSAAQPVVPLDPSLRRRVDALEEEASRVPSSAQNAAQRAAVVWDWANALARTGMTMPPDLPFTIAFLRWAEADGGEPWVPPEVDLSLASELRRLDRYIRELGRLERGESAGRLRFEPATPLVSRTWVTFAQVFTVGDEPLRPGAAFLVGKAGGADARSQNEDPRAPNYVSARASRSEVVLEPTTVPWNGVHSNMMRVVPAPGFRIAAGTLEPGDTVTFTFGDRAGGSRGYRVPTFSNDWFQLPIYVDPSGAGDFFGLPWPALEIVGRAEVHRVRVLAPSVIAAGEPFAITVRSEDDAMNRASGETPAYDVLRAGPATPLRWSPDAAAAVAGRDAGDAATDRRGRGSGGGDGAGVALLAAGAGAVARIEDLRIDEPGVHRFLVRSADGRLAAWSNPVWVDAAPRARILWGDTHGHTGFAEGQGSPRAYFTYAVEDARLDFVTLSEHDLWLDDGEWRHLQDLAREFTREGRFVGILGYEWTAFPDRGGHHNVFLRDRGAQRVGLQEATRLPDLYRLLRARHRSDQVLVIPHAHIPGDWRRSDPELERLVELYSVHGSFEWFANAYLRNGFELGFVGAGDTHLAKPGLAPPPLSNVSQPGGLAAVLAPEATTGAVFEALRARRSYATSGQRIVLDADLNGFAMGTRQPGTARRELHARVLGTAPIDRIDVVRNGDVVFSHSYLAAPLGARSLVQVSLESSSEVLGEEVDSPRGSRLWRGTLEVEGAELAALHPVGIDNPLRDVVERDETSPGRVRFEVLTRGRSDSFLLELAGAGAQTRLRVRLEPTRELGATYPVRPPAELAAEDFVLALDRLEDGRLARELRSAEGHVDRVAIQVVDPGGALDRTFEWIDLDAESVPEAYYYLRVTQLDGGRAWSTPWWVGGERLPATRPPLSAPTAPRATAPEREPAPG